MLKKGDKIKRKDGCNFGNGMEIVTVERIDGNGWPWIVETLRCVNPNLIKKVTNPRPHSELIKAWADDENMVVEILEDGEWVETLNPVWFRHFHYRIKPEKSEVDERIEALEAELMALKEARKREQV